ncbi:hypothetical protein BDP27DRAFT_1319380 [Rhodocollybia butyracea]|uniref:Uncharacterized protein n=1 Tax=Rhodocollybia butyracea TaxID=206335 RepID=A0A9P5Q2W0_9AGAR|nr:hypothetical protein BDP27DRAFT_1319380 [Rhodocollybia butyracea]
MVYSRSVLAALITVGVASSALAAPISSVVDAPAPAAGAIPTPAVTSSMSQSVISTGGPTAGTVAPPTATSNVAGTKTEQNSDGKQSEQIITVVQGSDEPGPALLPFPVLQSLGALLSPEPAPPPPPIPASGLQILRDFFSGGPKLPPPPPFPIPAFNPAGALEFSEEFVKQIDHDYVEVAEESQVCEVEPEQQPEIFTGVFSNLPQEAPPSILQIGEPNFASGSFHNPPPDELAQLSEGLVQVMELSEALNNPGGFPSGMAGFGPHGVF